MSLPRRPLYLDVIHLQYKPPHSIVPILRLITYPASAETYGGEPGRKGVYIRFK